MTQPEQSSGGTAAIEGSPIVGHDLAPEVGATEVRRARASVEIYYRTRPGDLVDIQARIYDALADGVGGDRHDCEGDVVIGDPIVAVDLTEHVRFVDGSRS